MTTTHGSWPRAEVQLDATGNGTLILGGNATQVRENTVEDARKAILALVADTARQLDRPVPMDTSDPSGTWHLLVYGDGTVDKIGGEPQRASAVPEPATPRTTTESPIEPQEVYADPGRDQSPMSPQTPPTGPRRQRTSFLSLDDRSDEPAKQGWRAGLNRLGFSLSPGAAERSERDDTSVVSQHWPGPRTIAVVNGKGGAGKTPATALLSAVFARQGGAGVLAWDNNQTRGTLGWRTEQGPHHNTILELLPSTAQLLGTTAQSADMAHYVHHQTSDRFDVLRSQPMRVASDQRLGADDVDRVHQVAAKFYRMIIMDSGNDESDPMWLRMVDHSHQLVVVTTTREDHAEAGALLLEHMMERGDNNSQQLAARATVIVSQADAYADASQMERVAAAYRDLGVREVVTIPYDRAMVKGVLRFGNLAPVTRRAWLAAAAAVARGL